VDDLVAEEAAGSRSIFAALAIDQVLALRKDVTAAWERRWPHCHRKDPGFRGQNGYPFK